MMFWHGVEPSILQFGSENVRNYIACWKNALFWFDGPLCNCSLAKNHYLSLCREYEPVKSQSAAFYYKTASEQGLSSEDADNCAVKYKGCALDTAQLRSLAPIEA